MRFLLIFIVFLPGCAALEQQLAAKQERQREQQEEQQRAYIDSLGNQCLALGYERSDPKIKDCMLQLHQSNLNQRQADRSAAIGYLLQQQQRPAATTTNCQRTFMGVQCNTR